MSEAKFESSKYIVQIDQAQGPVIGDNAHVEQHFHVAPPPAFPVSRDDLLPMIRQASTELRTCPAEIAGKHIERTEVAQIVEWALNADPKDRLGMLLDQPGGGKTVVMREVLVALEAADVPTLAIKADMLSGVRTRDELADRLGLPAPVEVCVRVLAEESERVVVILDQLDALSLSLSRDQAILDVMLSTLIRLREEKGVRIIASCRTFDLNNDPRLSTLRVEQKFQLRPLENEQIRSVLQRIGVTYEHLLPAHQQLLCVPLHLEIYARVVSASPVEKRLEGYRTLQELYEALWQRQVVMAPPDMPRPADRIAAVYQLVDSMQQNRRLTAPLATLDAYPEAAQYLERVGFIRRERSNYLFAHQTLFDYCYARRFVAHSRSLNLTVLASPQGLFERSQMIQVLAYLRGTDEERYRHELQALLFNTSLRIHLRFLLFGWFGALHIPSDDEFRLAQRLLQDNQDCLLFFQAASGNTTWFERLKESALPIILAGKDEMLIDATVHYLSTLIEARTEVVLGLLHPYLDHSEMWDNRVAYCLTRLHNWQSDEAIVVLQNLLQRGRLLERSALYLYQLAQSNPAGGCQILRIYLEQRLAVLLAQRQAEAAAAAEDRHAAYRVGSSNFFLEERALVGEHGINKVMARAAQEYPEAIIEHILPWFVHATLALGTSYPEDAYPFESIFSMHWYGDHIGEGPTFARHVAQALQQLAKTAPTKFRALATTLADVNALAVQRVLIEAYLCDPSLYADDSFDYLISDARRLHVGEPLENSHYDSQRLYAAVFSHLDASRRIVLEQLVLNLQPEWEQRTLGRRGLTQLRFLQGIPRELLSAPTRRELMELERKYPGVQSHVPQGVTGGWVGAPIDEPAQAKMSDAAWLGAMRKYDDSTTERVSGRDPLKGGVIQLSRALTEQTKKDPQRFYRLAQRFDERISLQYVIAVIAGLAESAAPAEWVFALMRQFKKRIEGSARKEVCWSIEQHADAGVPDDLLALMREWALTDPDPQEEAWQIPAGGGQPYYNGDPHMHGINTNRGAAILAFCRCSLNRQPAQVESVFQLLEQAANDFSTAVRTCVIQSLGPMLQHDDVRVVRILEQVLAGHPHLLQVSLVHQLLCWVHRKHFPRIRPLVEALLQNADDASRQAGARLACLAAFHYPEAEDLAEQVMDGDAARRRGAAQIYSRNLEAQHMQATCTERLLLLMQDEDEQVRTYVGGCFEHLQPENVVTLRPFIEAFLASPSLSVGAEHLVNYLKPLAADEHGLALKATTHILDVAGNEVVDIRTSWALLEQDLASLPLVVYVHADDPLIKASAMDKFERLLLLGSRAAKQVLMDWDRR